MSQPPKSLLFSIVVDQANKVIFGALQKEAFKEEFDVVAQNSSQSCGRCNEPKVSQRSLRRYALYQLNPPIDHEGVLRVGGRLHQTPLVSHEKHPVLLPKGHPVLTIVLSYIH